MEFKLNDFAQELLNDVTNLTIKSLEENFLARKINVEELDFLTAVEYVVTRERKSIPFATVTGKIGKRTFDELFERIKIGEVWNDETERRLGDCYGTLHKRSATAARKLNFDLFTKINRLKALAERAWSYRKELPLDFVETIEESSRSSSGKGYERFSNYWEAIENYKNL